MNLTQALHRNASAYPDVIATIFGERQRTYAELSERVARLAAGLHSIGVGRGDRVGILALNSDHYVEALYGIYWAGAVVNPVNIRWAADEIAFSLDDCETQVLIVDDCFAPMVTSLLTRSKCLRAVIFCGEGDLPDNMFSFERLIEQHPPVVDVRSCGDDLAGVFYTGGTTGFPKGVMLSHGNLYSNALAAVAEEIVCRAAITLHVAPMFHVADCVFLNASLMGAATNVIVPAFDPARALQAIQEHSVTHVLLVPTMIQMLINFPNLREYNLVSLRSVLYGASPISVATLERAMEALPRAGFAQAYGMTELSPVIMTLPAFWHSPQGRSRTDKLSSAGRPNLVSEVRIVDENDQPVPTGTVGEVVARGPGVMLGYWNRPEETKAALRGGWMHTGDGGYMDEDGFIFIVDRIKDMIVSGGENIYSLEVEAALDKHPAVAMSAVVGIPSQEWGESVHAAVVLKPGHSCSGEELGLHCRQLIANYKVPRSYSFEKNLPVSGAGKILKREIRRPFWTQSGRQVN
ncbi:long-chain-fatty-acid--CoA ligase [Pseudomonas sp. ICMP22404]|uniref:long-chain-fatty-acid--CoA ligase n=1 Tax=Pseudomonas sp. ICMP22404 TaxID=2583807 RepID=UPI001119C848|nr:long-chain-fatty-acid--CoA ligase [Pseudomonas sp. ICMP22404]TNF83374.1 long-chain-fatty-acid--CoA ligase [Pseudomonas sp. ICMP22404]